MKITALLAVAAAVLLGACASHTPRPEPSASACEIPSKDEVIALFDRWNASLAKGPEAVLANYAKDSVLLPTLWAGPQISTDEKLAYFQHFLENQPSGTIDWRWIDTGCNTATDTGLYTFLFKVTGKQAQARYTYTYRRDGKDWLITSHHSSLRPPPH